MTKLYFIVVFLLLSWVFNLNASILKFQDTVFIDPAYYNENFEGIGTSKVFTIETPENETIEIISIIDDLNYSVENPTDKSIINCVPNYYPNKNGNLIVEGGSKFAMEAICFFRNPKSLQYSSELFINYLTEDGEFLIDTITIIANRKDKDIFARNQTVTLSACGDGAENAKKFKITSTLLIGNSSAITINDIKIRSDLNYKINGFYNGINENSPDLKEELDFPLKQNSEYFSLELEIEDQINNTDFIFVDYYTDKGLVIDTLGMVTSNLKGITSKTWYQTFVSLDYKSVTSLKNGVKICSEQGYRVKSVSLEGEIEESEIELTEFVKVGDIINGDFIELSQYTITPQKIPVQRSGKFVYKLENVANGTVFEVDFPFTLEVDFSASVYDHLPNGYSVYPNPANSRISVKGSDNMQQLELVDLLGNTIISAQNTKVINVQNIESGVYFLKIVESNSTKLEKVIIE